MILEPHQSGKRLSTELIPKQNYCHWYTYMHWLTKKKPAESTKLCIALCLPYKEWCGFESPRSAFLSFSGEHTSQTIHSKQFKTLSLIKHTSYTHADTHTSFMHRHHVVLCLSTKHTSYYTHLVWLSNSRLHMTTLATSATRNGS